VLLFLSRLVVVFYNRKNRNGFQFFLRRSVQLGGPTSVQLKNFFGAVAVFSDFFCVFCFINFYVFLNF